MSRVCKEQLQRIIGPTFTLVSNERVRRQCRIDDNLDNDWITDAIAGATAFIEEYLGCAIAAATYRLTLDRFPRKPESIPVPLWPINAITEIAYTAADGTTATVDLATIVQPASMGRYAIERTDYLAWPTARCTPNAVRVTLTAGWQSPAEIPQTITRAALMLIAHWYENRESVLVGSISKELEFGTSQLLELARPDQDLIA